MFFLSIPTQFKSHLFRFSLLGSHLNSIALNEVTFDYLEFCIDFVRSQQFKLCLVEQGNI